MDDGGAGAGFALFGMVFLLFELALIGAVFVGLWKVFEKAGKPGWAGIIPIYNVIVMCELVGRPVWWVVLLFVPCANFVVAIVLAMDMAKSFGKDTAYGIGMAFLPFIFYPLLGFSDARYLGPAALAGASPYGQPAYPPQAPGYPSSGPQYPQQGGYPQQGAYPQQGGYPQQGQPSQQQCMRCGAGVPVGGRVCPQCGTPLG